MNDKPYVKALEEYGIKFFRNAKGQISLKNKIYTYNYKYPDKDKLSPDRNLSNEWGYFMIFKSIGIKVENFLKNYILNYDVIESDIITYDMGYKIEIEILDIKS